jgi:uncharacterized protein DUF5666
MKSILGVSLVVAFALLLVAGAPLMASVLEESTKGKVTAFEAGKSLSVESGGAQKQFKITADTKIEGDLAVGKEVEVWAKDGMATKIKVKE